MTVGGQEEDRRHRDHRNSLEETLREHGRRMMRLHTAGNAGGVIATLSFIGSAFGRGAPVGSSFFWLLVVFVVGLFFSAASIVTEIIETRARINAMDAARKQRVGRSPEAEEHRAKARDARKIMNIVTSGASICTGGGILFGLYLIYGLTLTPPTAS